MARIVIVASLLLLPAISMAATMNEAAGSHRRLAQSSMQMGGMQMPANKKPTVASSIQKPAMASSMSSMQKKPAMASGMGQMAGRRLAQSSMQMGGMQMPANKKPTVASSIQKPTMASSMSSMQKKPAMASGMGQMAGRRLAAAKIGAPNNVPITPGRLAPLPGRLG